MVSVFFAVSYTHLDVYKRQEINQSTILALSHEESLHLKTNRIQPETEILLSDGLGSLYSGIFKGFVSQLAQVEVDVYKRQDQ